MPPQRHTRSRIAAFLCLAATSTLHIAGAFPLSPPAALTPANTPAQPTPQPPQPPPPKPPQPTLVPGSPAPALTVDTFIRGTPITSFQPGHIYIIEFWATWCGPCITAIPHLSAVQREYESKNVTICAINILQPHKPGIDTLSTVRAFVTNRGDTMNYTVAYDSQPDNLVRTWLKAAGRDGIPCCFIIDRTGHIAWIGNPLSLPFVLDEVVRDTWDLTTGPTRLKAALASLTAALNEYKTSLAAGDAAWSALERAHPALIRTRHSTRLSAMFRNQHIDAACALANQSLDAAALTKDSGTISSVLESLDTASLQHVAARELLLKAAQANFSLADTSEPGPHIVLARALFYNQQPDQARAAASRALELTPESSRAATSRWLAEIEAEAAAAK
jgi:thiol-disulfide isomerase/thioredoxin